MKFDSLNFVIKEESVKTSGSGFSRRDPGVGPRHGGGPRAPLSPRSGEERRPPTAQGTERRHSETRDGGTSVTEETHRYGLKGDGGRLFVH